MCETMVLPAIMSTGLSKSCSNDLKMANISCMSMGFYQGNDAIGNLMNDFRCDTAEQIKLDALKEVVYQYKNNPEEVAIMCAELEKWSLEERQEGRQEGRREGRREGEGRLSSLLKLLKADNRWQDWDLAIE